MAWHDYMTDDERAYWFAYTSPGQLDAYLKRRGLDVTCTDPETLRAAAQVQAAALSKADHDAAASPAA